MPGEKKRLEDAYRFPGFRPSRWVRGVFGDSQVRIMVLEREQKKRLLAFAVKSTVCFRQACTAVTQVAANCQASYLAARVIRLCQMRTPHSATLFQLRGP